MRHPRRYTAASISRNLCVLTITATGAQREYWCPPKGGVVRLVTEHNQGAAGDVVYSGLSAVGSNTLEWDPSDTWPLSFLIQMHALVAFNRDQHGECLADRWAE